MLNFILPKTYAEWAIRNLCSPYLETDAGNENNLYICRFKIAYGIQYRAQLFSHA